MGINERKACLPDKVLSARIDRQKGLPVNFALIQLKSLKYLQQITLDLRFFSFTQPTIVQMKNLAK